MSLISVQGQFSDFEKKQLSTAAEKKHKGKKEVKEMKVPEEEQAGSSADQV